MGQGRLVDEASECQGRRVLRAVVAIGDLDG